MRLSRQSGGGSSRHQAYLRSHYKALLGYAAGLIAIIGGLMLVPLLVIPFYPDNAAYAGGFFLSGLPPLILGGLLWRRLKPKQAISLSVQDGSVVVVMTWIVAVIAAAVPFMAVSGLSFSQAIFESTSGWTTTGLSLVNVMVAPEIVLFHRSFIQFAGGAGFAIIALSAISAPFSAGLVSAEGRTDQLAPNVRHSANIVLRIYGGYVIFGILALRIAGMDWFDAINHAFTALATGGFSTRLESIGYWDSAVIEAVIIVLMILGSVNFFIAYTLLRGKFRAVVRSGELRLMTVAILVGTTLLLLIVTSSVYPTFEKALRVAVFETISALTGTGFSTTTYIPWADFGWMILIALMLIGGGTGSTSGGIKQFRVYVLYKAIRWEIQRAFLPRHMVNEPVIWQGDRRELLNDKLVRQVALFTGLFLMLFLFGSGIIAAYGYSMSESTFEFASALATVGLSVGITQPDMPLLMMWTMSVGMLLGRLEMFAVIVGVLKLFTDVSDMVFERGE